jgi:hypothetical protein
VKGPFHVADAVRSSSHVTLQVTGVNEYVPGPAKDGERVPPLHFQSAAHAVPMGFTASSTRASLPFVLAGGIAATVDPAVLLTAPLTTLTATSEEEGASGPAALHEARRTKRQGAMKLRWVMTISLLSGAHRNDRASEDPARRRAPAGVTPARA